MSKVIGIDLGTTNSCVAVMEGGEAVVIPNAEGNRTTPSVVAFSKTGERMVGQVAKRQAITNPDRTISSIKREMGSDHRVSIDGKSYTPQEISAMILQKLKSDAEAYLGSTVTEAVITVPAYFTDAQRQATKDAGKIAGLDVKRIINEPTAAALAYGVDKEQAQKIMVYDLGGGTFDVSILEIDDGVIEVLATAGNNRLGGDDFDQCIMKYLVSEFKRTEGIDLSGDKVAMQRLKEAAEKAKIELSGVTTSNINLPYITADATGPKHLDVTLTRAKFNELTGHLVDATMGPVRQAMSDAGLKPSDLSKVLMVGGSSRIPAVVEAVKGQFHNELEGGPKIYFCGNSISPTYLNNIISLCKGKRFSINVISKSGTTTETSLAFRVLRRLLEDEMGVEEANKRIYATTDRAKGTLKQLADAQGWPTFVVPDDVGGRYSVLSAVGLLPIAAAGISIDDVMKGAADAMERFSVLSPDNDAYKYAAIRNILYRKGKSIEILECYEPNFTLMNEWYKQLFGESEGKDNKGLFPASCIFSTDLHSMGQFIQEGSRIMFETIVDVKKPAQDLFIDKLEGNFDGLNFLADQNMSVVNRKAMEGTILAHTDGGVPEVVIEVDDLSAYNVGYLIYFFWRACACSGYLLSVNPFNQPGVESYKKNMFALLGKPGYEGLTAELEAKLK